MTVNLPGTAIEDFTIRPFDIADRDCYDPSEKNRKGFPDEIDREVLVQIHKQVPWNCPICEEEKQETKEKKEMKKEDKDYAEARQEVPRRDFGQEDDAEAMKEQGWREEDLEEDKREKEWMDGQGGLMGTLRGMGKAFMKKLPDVKP